MSSGAPRTLPGEQEAAHSAVRAAAVADRLHTARDTAARLKDLAAAEKAGTPLRLAAAPVGPPGVTAPATLDSPAVAAVAVGLGFYVEAANLEEAAELAAQRVRALEEGGGDRNCS